MKLTVDTLKADPLYVYYFVSLPASREKIIRESTASGVPKTNVTYLKTFPISLPPLDYQKSVVSLLSVLDDKIELNRQMNHTLEQMAQSLYKSWFVDFDPVVAKAAGKKPFGMSDEVAALFPDKFVDSKLGEIPEGWEVGFIEDLGTIICGKTPSTRDPLNFGNDIPFVTIPDMHNQIIIVKTQRYLSTKGAVSQANKFLPPFSTCVSCIATPGLVTLTSEKSQTNQQINSIIPSDNYLRFYNYWCMRFVADEILAGGSGGTVFHNLNKQNFSRIKILIPPPKLIKNFHDLINNWMQIILCNLHSAHRVY